MHGKKGKDQRFMEYNEEKYPRSEMDKAGESSRKGVSASRRYREASLLQNKRRDERYSGSKRLVSELFLREKKRGK